MPPKKTTKIKKDAATLIFPNLYLGPCSAASSVAFLTSNSITRVLSIGSTPSSKVPGVIYNHLSLTDSQSSSIAKVVDIAITIIEAALGSHNRTGKILVHCSAAVSRSPTIVVAYLMKRQGLSLKDSLGRVVSARPTVSPNSGFLKQLKELEEVLFGRVTLSVDDMPKRREEREALFKLNTEQSSEGA
jgi:atypical dual specificity phosphatase